MSENISCCAGIISTEAIDVLALAAPLLPAAVGIPTDILFPCMVGSISISSADQPVNYALRNAAEDLTQFADYKEVLESFTASSYRQYQLGELPPLR